LCCRLFGGERKREPRRAARWFKLKNPKFG
jgi:hypothetical protein